MAGPPNKKLSRVTYMAMSWAIAVLVIPLLLAIAAKARGVSGVARTPTEIRLRAGWPTRIVLTIFFVLFPVGFLVLDPGGSWPVALLLAVLGSPVVLDIWISEIRITDRGLTSRSPWRRVKTIEWSDIVMVGRVSNGGGWQWNYVDTRDKGKVRWSGLMDGGEYLERALDRFAPDARRVASRYLEHRK